MHADSKKLLSLMFRPGETISVSPNQFGYHSIPLENALSDEVTLVLPDPKHPIQTCPSDRLLFTALNPILGWRRDENCFKFRNFLIEVDVGPKEKQIEYLTNLGIPFSAMIWSGGKSVHCLISLANDLPSEKVWRQISEWMLGIITLADPLCKNPSRSIRLPGPEREPGKFQYLIDYRGPVKLEELHNWLSKFPNSKPKPKEKRALSKEASFDRIKPWAMNKLINGLDPTKGRNGQWYSLAYEFCLSGYSQDDTEEILLRFFTEENDFKEKELFTTIESAFKNCYSRRQS